MAGRTTDEPSSRGPGADSAFPLFSVGPKPIDRTDDEPSAGGPATHVLSECERLKNEKEAVEHDKLEARCDSDFFRRDKILTPSQREKRRTELECERREKEAREREEELEVCRDSTSNRIWF